MNVVQRLSDAQLMILRIWLITTCLLSSTVGPTACEAQTNNARSYLDRGNLKMRDASLRRAGEMPFLPHLFSVSNACAW